VLGGRWEIGEMFPSLPAKTKSMVKRLLRLRSRFSPFDWNHLLHLPPAGQAASILAESEREIGREMPGDCLHLPPGENRWPFVQTA